MRPQKKTTELTAEEKAFNFDDMKAGKFLINNFFVYNDLLNIIS